MERVNPEGHPFHVQCRVHDVRRLLRRDRDDPELVCHPAAGRNEVEIREDECTFADGLLHELEFAPRRLAGLGEMLDQPAFAIHMDVRRRPLGVETKAVVEVGAFDRVGEHPLEVVFPEVGEYEFDDNRLFVWERVSWISAEEGLVDRAFLNFVHSVLLVCGLCSYALY